MPPSSEQIDLVKRKLVLESSFQHQIELEFRYNRAKIRWGCWKPEAPMRGSCHWW
jgi:hypothetical protein